MLDLNAILSKIENVFNINEYQDEELKKQYFFSALSECSVNYKNEEFNILIGIKGDFPLSSPGIFWKDFKGNFYPHIEEMNGKICYLEDDLYTFDYENPEGVISSCINMAVTHIYNGKYSLNDDDFINEFESYWSRADIEYKADSYINLDENIRMIKTYLNNKKLYIYDDKKDLEYALQKDNETEKEDCIYEALYIPLKSNNNIFPPKHNELWKIGEIRNIIIKNLEKKELKKIRELLKKHKFTNFFIISFPNKKNERVVIGICCYDFYNFVIEKSLHPIITTWANCKIDLIDIDRKDKNYLLNRGGALDFILDKKILVLGCGSLGGHIIEQLVNVGINNITIVDKDKFSIENIYRHVLGYDCLKSEGSYKSEEMKNYLEKKYRNLKVTAIAYELIDCIKDESLDLEKFDLIIIAIGNPNMEFELNKIIQSLSVKIPTIFTWNEPNGIGGHVLVTNNGRTGGCYECLYSNPSTGDRVLKNKASLVDSAETYAKKYAGCGSAFLPYSYLDSVQTALLCSRSVLEVLIGAEKGNPLKTWKGKNYYNVKTTPRYDLTESEMEKSKYLYKNLKCNICGEKKIDI